MRDHVLSIDCGTQSIRALIFDEKGNLLAKAKKTFDFYISLKPDWFEAPCEKFYESLVDVCRSVRESDPDLYKSVKAISVTTQRDTYVLVDKEGKPIRNAIIWMDNRLAEGISPLNPVLNSALSLVKMKKVMEKLRLIAPIHWIQINEPENWEKTHKCLQLSAYLNYCLDGEYKDSDASIVGHLPFDYKSRNWDAMGGMKSLMFNIEKERRYEAAPSLSILGHLTYKASKDLCLPEGLPIAAAGSDKACEAVGTGCNKDSVGNVSLGSQATLETTTEKYYELDPFFPPFTAVRHNSFNPEITIYRGFWLVRWFKDEFAKTEELMAEETGRDAIEILNDSLENIPIGCDGLMLQPFWGQELMRPEARGCRLGFSDAHTRLHIYRAIIEGIGFTLLDGIHKIEKKSGKRLEKIAISGGGSQSDFICQIAADMFDREVYRVQTYETSGLGAAVCGFVALGTYKDIDEATKAMVHPTDIFQPIPANASKYRILYEKVYKNIYEHVKPVYKLMSEAYEGFGENI